MSDGNTKHEDLSADELARACAKAMWARDKASQHLGMDLVESAAGRARLTMTVLDFMTNSHDICHGGYIFTLADSAFAFACNSYNQNTLAQHCSVSFLAPVKVGDRLTASAREISRSGRSGLYDISVTRDDGETVAQFRGHSRTVKGTLLPV
jgi:acyl-CoA thioesterase